MDYEEIFKLLNIDVMPVSENYTPEEYGRNLMSKYGSGETSDIAYSNYTDATVGTV